MASPFTQSPTPESSAAESAPASGAATPNQYKTEAQRLLLEHVARSKESIRAIAKGSRVPLFSLQQVLAGKSSSVKPATAAKLAAYLGVTAAEITGRPEKPASPSFPAQLAEALRPSPAPNPATEAAPQPGPAVPVIGVAWSQLTESPFNLRKHFDKEKLQELADSIHEQGILENLIARPLPTAEGKPQRYEIVFGARRYRAVGLNIKAGRADKTYVMPVAVRNLDEPQARAIQLIENLQRENNTPSEEGEAFQALTELGWETKDIAQRIGKSLAYVQQRITLVKRAAPELRNALDKGQIGFDAARTLASGGSLKQQSEIVAAIKAGDYRYRTADMIRTELTRALIPARFALFDPTHYKGETREVDGESYFADRAQFDQLQEAAIAEKQKELQAAGWSWVDQREFFHRGDYAPETSANRKKAGCLIVLKHTGEVEIHEGLVSLASKEGVAASRGGGGGLAGGTAADAPSSNPTRPAADDYQRQLKAGERFVAALGDYVVKRPALALRLYVFQGEQSRSDFPSFDEARPATWPEIAGANEKQLGKIVLPQIGFNPHARADEAMLDLAKKAGLKVPAHMQPVKPAAANGAASAGLAADKGRPSRDAGSAKPRPAREARK